MGKAEKQVVAASFILGESFRKRRISWQVSTELMLSNGKIVRQEFLPQKAELKNREQCCEKLPTPRSLLTDTINQRGLAVEQHVQYFQRNLRGVRFSGRMCWCPKV
ncbi:UNVERIFIED_CONTAM: hypothetical protein FKN15_000590 [Acipenser sinensis]